MAECAFCGRDRPLGKEHVIPKWLLDMLLGPDRATRMKAAGGGFVRFLDAEGPYEALYVDDRQEGPGDSEVKVVCKGRDGCNEGWMSNLEGAVKPIMEPLILGEKTGLRTSDQRLLAFWAAKTTAMVEYTGRRRTFSKEQRHLLYAGRSQYRLPPGFSVWAGSTGEVTESPKAYYYFHYPAAIAWDEGPVLLPSAINRWNMQQTTFVFGHLVLVVVSTTIRPVQRFDVVFGPYDDAMRQIWPSPRHCVWPVSGRWLDDQAIRRVSSAILGFVAERRSDSRQ